MSVSFYEYQNPQKTYTLEQYIACQSDSTVCYNNLSFLDRIDNIQYATYNVLSDYLDELREEYCVKVNLNTDQLEKYKYRPKLLCNDIYGNGELAFIILIINDMCDVKDFVKPTLLMPKKIAMADLTKYLFNSNKSSIAAYNDK